VTVKGLCQAVDLSRQAYYQGRRARQGRAIDEAAVVELVQRERQLQPRIGGRKLRVLLKVEWETEMGLRLGRDRFFKLLKTHGLLIARRRRRGPRTTDARHGFKKYPNLFSGQTWTGPHQAWVSDVTYVRTAEGWLYLWLISDAWSRKIVGYSGEDTLEAEGGMRALAMAMAQLPEGARPLHHSDRGIQYCCHTYIKQLEARRMGVSMTEENHCYENGQAERVNGILKQEYGLGETFGTKAMGRAAMKEGIDLFNTRRPHMSLGYRIPGQVHEPAA
jgi:putative transposase